MKFPSCRLLLTAIFVTFGGSFHFGYQIAVVNPTEPIFRQFFNESFKYHYGSYLGSFELTTLWSITVGILVFGAFLGSFSVPSIENKIGPKNGLMISYVLFMAATFPSALSYTINCFELFIIGRLFYGIGVGIATGLQVVYLTEISPKMHRGLINVFNGFAIQFGLTSGAFLSLKIIWGTQTQWQTIYWVEMIPSVIGFIVLVFSHESPYFLIKQDRVSCARSSISFYHKGICGEYVDKVIATINEELDFNKLSLGFFESFCLKMARRGIFMGLVANIGVSCSGIVVISFFTTKMLTTIGFSIEKAAYANLIICGSSLAGSLLSVMVIEHFGRRPLLLLSCGGLATVDFVVFGLLLIYDKYHFTEIGYIYIGIDIVFMFLFTLGLAPISLFISSELVPQNAKNSIQSFVITIQYMTGFIIPFIFLPLTEMVGYYTFLLFAFFMTFCVISFYCYLPETKNMHLLEILNNL